MPTKALWLNVKPPNKTKRIFQTLLTLSQCCDTIKSRNSDVSKKGDNYERKRNYKIRIR